MVCGQFSESTSSITTIIVCDYDSQTPVLHYRLFSEKKIHLITIGAIVKLFSSEPLVFPWFFSRSVIVKEMKKFPESEEKTMRAVSNTSAQFSDAHVRFFLREFSFDIRKPVWAVCVNSTRVLNTEPTSPDVYRLFYLILVDSVEIITVSTVTTTKLMVIYTAPSSLSAFISIYLPGIVPTTRYVNE